MEQSFIYSVRSLTEHIICEYMYWMLQLCTSSAATEPPAETGIIHTILKW